MKQQFTWPRTIKPRTKWIIDQANSIIEEYRLAGYTLTLRQLYYQFVARDLIANDQKNYKNLGATMTNARMWGLVDWDALEDRVRNLQSWAAYNHPDELLARVRRGWQLDLWEGQQFRPEVWVEKEALAGIVEKACAPYRVPFMSCKGYSSASEEYAASKRMEHHLHVGQQPLLLYLGDHDPSGMDMTRDHRERLNQLSRAEEMGERVLVVRLALNYDQVDAYKPPPNPAKMTDARAPKYIEQFGRTSWELDALKPDVLVQIIQDAIREHLDEDLFDRRLDLEINGKDFMEQKINEINWEGMPLELSDDE